LSLRSEISARRKSQVGTGSRSEKIKTYNYKDTRMSGEGGRFITMF
jgi:peptide chain release factor 1